MKVTAILLFALTLLLVAIPARAITCSTVRSYVAQVGLQQAQALARAAGMTPAQERMARRCLTSRRTHG